MKQVLLVGALLVLTVNACQPQATSEQHNAQAADPKWLNSGTSP